MILFSSNTFKCMLWLGEFLISMQSCVVDARFSLQCSRLQDDKSMASVNTKQSAQILNETSHNKGAGKITNPPQHMLLDVSDLRDFHVKGWFGGKHSDHNMEYTKNNIHWYPSFNCSFTITENDWAYMKMFFFSHYNHWQCSYPKKVNNTSLMSMSRPAHLKNRNYHNIVRGAEATESSPHG